MSLRDDKGISPVIGVILMVAITVVLAATIYVWVSGMGGGGGTNFALKLQQASHIQDGNTFNKTEGYLNFTVLSVQGNPGWEDLKVVVGGTTVWDGSTGSLTNFTVKQGSDTVINGNQKTGAVLAGQTMSLNVGDGTNDLEVTVGTTITIIDVNSGSTVASFSVTY